eukprot:scaffold241673_cov22-Tisochrysis_lutea.AAC.2
MLWHHTRACQRLQILHRAGRQLPVHRSHPGQCARSGERRTAMDPLDWRDRLQKNIPVIIN